MGACMTWICTGCGFEYQTPAALFDHESGCSLVMRDRLEEADAELTRLRAELAESAKEHQEALDIADRFLRRALKAERDLNGVSAELAEARALVEKREAQIACLVRRPWGSHRHTDIDGVDSWEIHKLGFGDVPTLRVIQYDGTRAGLLAAVDEATKS